MKEKLSYDSFLALQFSLVLLRWDVHTAFRESFFEVQTHLKQWERIPP